LVLQRFLSTQELAALGDYFFTWLQPPSGAGSTAAATVDWSRATLELKLGEGSAKLHVCALAHEGLSLFIQGPELAPFVGTLQQRLQPQSAPGHAERASALVLYAPAGTRLPFTRPTVVERVSTPHGHTELIMLPYPADQLPVGRALDDALLEACNTTRAEVISLAGLLPSLSGFRFKAPGKVVTTGHGATAIAMFFTVGEVLRCTHQQWSKLQLGVLGFGSIGQAALQLCVAELGAPAAVSIADPRFGTDVSALAACDLVLAATSRGKVIDIGRLPAGAIVIDDSFPRAFDDAAAWRRMRNERDILCVGGGMIAVGELQRHSPFPGALADAARASFPTRWLPGCHAEALLLSIDRTLTPTEGMVQTAQCLRMLREMRRLGWSAAPLHLGTEEVDEQLPGVVAAKRARQ
jgi:hypothetical protein